MICGQASEIKSHGAGISTQLNDQAPRQRLSDAEAIALLADIPTSKTLDYRKDEEHAGFLTCYTILQELKVNQSSNLSNFQEGQLLSISEKKSNQADAMAQLILLQYAENDYSEVLVKPDADRSVSGSNQFVFKPTKKQLSLFPNPANDQITLLNIPAKTVMIDVLDAQGRRKSNFLTKHSASQIISIADLEPGTYQVRCMNNNGAELESTSLIVE